MASFFHQRLKSDFLRRILPFSLLLLLAAQGSSAARSGCLQAAREWIAPLDSAKEQILINHARTKCEFAARWMRESREKTEKSDRERMCNDLVLIWTHKECIYFRDYVTEEAYSPCKKWSRDMFRHCMENDTEWFLPTP